MSGTTRGYAARKRPPGMQIRTSQAVMRLTGQQLCMKACVRETLKLLSQSTAAEYVRLRIKDHGGECA